MSFKSQIAVREDTPAIEALISLSMGRLLDGVLTPAQIAKSHASMGLDTQLLDDGTYFLIFDEETLVGCGGWS